MSPIIREFQKRNISHFVLHTGQHYDYQMDKIFFDELNLPQPDYNVKVGSGNHGEQTGKILERIEEILLKDQPDIVLVQGDTNTVLAGSLAASKLHIKVGHVEAGLRSFDRRMPEEINRIVADHIADFLFVPSDIAKQNLIDEGISTEKIFNTGNTIVDAVFQNIQLINDLSTPGLTIEPKKYILVTAHRPENVDIKERLKNIFQALATIQKELQIPVIFPMHPRTRKNVEKFGIKTEGITIIEPQGYLFFLRLEADACLLLSDSGGVQEEGCILGVPCVTLRDNTERPETIKVGSNVLAGTNPDKIVKKSIDMLQKDTKWKNPYGDGNAAKYITDNIIPYLS